MKIAVSAAGGSLASQMDGRFDRCAYFVVVESDTFRHTAFANSALRYSGGLISAAVRELKKRRVEILIAREPDPAVREVLEKAGVRVAGAPQGTVRQAVEAFLQSG